MTILILSQILKNFSLDLEERLARPIRQGNLLGQLLSKKFHLEYPAAFLFSTGERETPPPSAYCHTADLFNGVQDEIVRLFVHVMFIRIIRSFSNCAKVFTM